MPGPKGDSFLVCYILESVEELGGNAASYASLGKV